ncbi:MAG: HIT family protein [Candidatus Bathyarchaeota archaeon]|jgi:histidine triad (HIT) family protein
MGEGCPFCSITAGKTPASVVYEDEDVVAFMDLNPVDLGHTLIVPREHWENIYEIPEEKLARLIALVKRISVAVKKTVDADGIKVIQLNGKAAGQVVFHLHFHIIPASFKTGIRKGHHGRVASDRAELDEVAQKIRKNL